MVRGVKGTFAVQLLGHYVNSFYTGEAESDASNYL